MKRKFLEDLGVEEEVINKIMTENGKDVTSLSIRVKPEEKIFRFYSAIYLNHEHEYL